MMSLRGNANETTKKYNKHPPEWRVFRRPPIPSTGKNAEPLELSYIARKRIDKTILALSTKTKHTPHLLYELAILRPCIHPREMNGYVHQRTHSRMLFYS